MNIKTFSQFISNINEDSIEPADQDLDIVIDDVILDSGEEIKSEEILGVIVSSKSEKDFLDYFYDKYGNNAFTEVDTQTLVTFYNEYQEEVNKKETEEEQDAESGMETGEGEKDGEFSI